MRGVFLALALLLAPVAAWANGYDALIVADGATHYYALSANANDGVSVGPVNGSLVGSGTFGGTIATNVSGFTPGSSASLIAVQVAWDDGPGIGVYTTEFWVKTSSSTIQTPIGYDTSASSRTYLSVGITQNGPVPGYGVACSSGYVAARGVDAGQEPACGTSSVADGNPHYIVIKCTGILSGNCGVYVDTVLQNTFGMQSNYALGPFTMPNHDTIGNDISSLANTPMLGPVGGVATYQNVALSSAIMTFHYLCGLGTGPCVRSTSHGQLVQGE